MNHLELLRLKKFGRLKIIPGVRERAEYIIERVTGSP